MAALLGVARGVISRITGSLGGGAGRRALLAGTAGGILGSVGIPGVDLFPGGGPSTRRRRRRKMFTSTDIAQFAAAESIAGKAAARSLMMIRAAQA